MTEVISVRFKNKGKIYYFEPNGITASQGDHLIVETAKGLEFAECVSGNHLVDDSAVRPPLRPVVRIATQEDILKSQENRRREDEAFEICREKILKHGLDMKLVDVEYNLNGLFVRQVGQQYLIYTPQGIQVGYVFLGQDGQYAKDVVVLNAVTKALAKRWGLSDKKN